MASWGVTPLPGVTMATAKRGGSGTANLPPDVKARMDKIAGFKDRIGRVGGGPPMIGPPDRVGGPGLIGPPETINQPPMVGPPQQLGGVPPSMGGGYADVMRILMGGSNPNLLGQPQQYPSFGFPQFSNLLLNWGGRNG